MIAEWDEVVVTGMAWSPERHFEKLRGTVGTVKEDGFFKVWPHEGTEDKVWFRIEDVVVEASNDGGNESLR